MSSIYLYLCAKLQVNMLRNFFKKILNIAHFLGLPNVKGPLSSRRQRNAGVERLFKKRPMSPLMHLKHIFYNTCVTYLNLEVDVHSRDLMIRLIYNDYNNTDHTRRLASPCVLHVRLDLLLLLLLHHLVLIIHKSNTRHLRLINKIKWLPNDRPDSFVQYWLRLRLLHLYILLIFWMSLLLKPSLCPISCLLFSWKKSPMILKIPPGLSYGHTAHTNTMRTSASTSDLKWFAFAARRNSRVFLSEGSHEYRPPRAR